MVIEIEMEEIIILEITTTTTMTMPGTAMILLAEVEIRVAVEIQAMEATKEAHRGMTTIAANPAMTGLETSPTRFMLTAPLTKNTALMISSGSQQTTVVLRAKKPTRLQLQSHQQPTK